MLKKGIFAKFLHDRNQQNLKEFTKNRDNFLQKSRHFPSEIT